MNYYVNFMDKFELFPGKSMSDLFKDIYDNQINKKQRISELIAEMRKVIRHAGDMAVVGPIIKDLVDTSVKNDDSLIKLAAIAQKIMNATNKSESEEGFLTEEEQKQLLKNMDEDLKKLQEGNEEEVDKITTDVEELKRKVNRINV